MALQAIRPHHDDRSDDFARLVERDLDRVWRFLRSLLRDPDLARDLCHDTFLRLHESLRRDEIRQLDDGLPRAAYVFAAARNAAASHGRRARRQATFGLDASDDIADAGRTDLALVRGELRTDLDTALARLDEDHRAVFLLSEIEGLRYEEIAEVLDIPAGTVASRKHHAVQRLRRDMERMGHAVS